MADCGGGRSGRRAAVGGGGGGSSVTMVTGATEDASARRELQDGTMEVAGGRAHTYACAGAHLGDPQALISSWFPRSRRDSSGVWLPTVHLPELRLIATALKWHLRVLLAWGVETLVSVLLPLRGGGLSSDEEGIFSEDEEANPLSDEDTSLFPWAHGQALPSHTTALSATLWFDWAVAEDWLALNVYSYAAGWTDSTPTLLFDGPIGRVLAESRNPGVLARVKELLRADADPSVEKLAHRLGKSDILVPLLPSGLELDPGRFWHRVARWLLTVGPDNLTEVTRDPLYGDRVWPLRVDGQTRPLLSVRPSHEDTAAESLPGAWGSCHALDEQLLSAVLQGLNVDRRCILQLEGHDTPVLALGPIGWGLRTCSPHAQYTPMEVEQHQDGLALVVKTGVSPSTRTISFEAWEDPHCPLCYSSWIAPRVSDYDRWKELMIVRRASDEDWVPRALADDVLALSLSRHIGIPTEGICTHSIGDCRRRLVTAVLEPVFHGRLLRRCLKSIWSREETHELTEKLTCLEWVLGEDHDNPRWTIFYTWLACGAHALASSFDRRDKRFGVDVFWVETPGRFFLRTRASVPVGASVPGMMGGHFPLTRQDRAHLEHLDCLTTRQLVANGEVNESVILGLSAMVGPAHAVCATVVQTQLKDDVRTPNASGPRRLTEEDYAGCTATQYLPAGAVLLAYQRQGSKECCGGDHNGEQLEIGYGDWMVEDFRKQCAREPALYRRRTPQPVSKSRRRKVKKPSPSPGKLNWAGDPLFSPAGSIHPLARSYLMMATKNLPLCDADDFNLETALRAMFLACITILAVTETRVKTKGGGSRTSANISWWRMARTACTSPSGRARKTGWAPEPLSSGMGGWLRPIRILRPPGGWPPSPSWARTALRTTRVHNSSPCIVRPRGTQSHTSQCSGRSTSWFARGWTEVTFRS